MTNGVDVVGKRLREVKSHTVGRDNNQNNSSHDAQSLEDDHFDSHTLFILEVEMSVRTGDVWHVRRKRDRFRSGIIH